jgi:hypothetical protein
MRPVLQEVVGEECNFIDWFERYASEAGLWP